MVFLGIFPLRFPDRLQVTGLQVTGLQVTGLQVTGTTNLRLRQELNRISDNVAIRTIGSNHNGRFTIKLKNAYRLK